LIGLCSSYFFNMPYGPTLVLCLGLVFVCAAVLRVVLNRKAFV
jgi:ABC-type Mn2+/Zn2+ transport system permease subunit